MTAISAPEKVGIDSKIYLIQRFLNEYLTDLYSGVINVYGRIYETQRDDGTYPEAYVYGNEYKEVFVNDREALTVGFIEKSREIRDRKLYAKLDVVFTGNINALLNVRERQDERIFLQLYQGLRKSMLIESIANPKRGITDVFSGFKTDGIKYRDMHPWFCFSFEIEVQYTETIC